MTLQLTPELAAALAQRAAQQGTSPEQVAVGVLSAQLLPPPAFEPQDEWERRLLAIGRPLGAGLTNEQLSREQMYD